MTITFDNVQTAGLTMVKESADNQGFSLGEGYAPFGLFYEVTTTAIFADSVTVCLSALNRIIDESQVSLWHCKDGTCDNVTTSNTRDGDVITICGQVSSFSWFVLGVPALNVQIDIKPGSYPNCFNNDGKGVIPVAILSGNGFDATQVNPATVSLDGQAVRVVGKSNTQAHTEDVNLDGLDDLVVQIEDVDGTYEEGNTTATLTGNKFDGTVIKGTDSICIVP